jgi:hypothetical protein
MISVGYSFRHRRLPGVPCDITRAGEILRPISALLASNYLAPHRNWDRSDGGLCGVVITMIQLKTGSFYT